jgi:hypothetical protein
MPHEIDNATDNSPRAGQEVNRVPVNGNLPRHKQNGDEQDWSKPNAQSQSRSPFTVVVLLLWHISDLQFS